MSMSKENNCYLAIDAGGSNLKSALIQSNGNIIKDSFNRAPIDSNGTLEYIRDAYIQLVEMGVDKANAYSLNLAGVGIATPGPFNYDDGCCLMKHKFKSIYGVPIRPWIEKATGKIPIHFVHDSTAFILGAVQGGKYSRFKRIAGVIIGTGLGFASMFKSVVFTNTKGGPGISIYTLPYRDKTAEDYVSRRAIINSYRDKMPDADDTIDVIDISRLARAGQTEAIEVFVDMGSNLAEILYGVIKENSFECLLLGGAISKSADLFLPTLKQDLENIPSLSLIEPVSDIDNAPLLGAIHKLLSA